jgi:hypothetical protein
MSIAGIHRTAEHDGQVGQNMQSQTNQSERRTMTIEYRYSCVHLCVCLVMCLTVLAIDGCGTTNHSSGGVFIPSSIVIESIERDSTVENGNGVLRGRVKDSLMKELMIPYIVKIKGASLGADSIVGRYQTPEHRIILPAGRYTLEVKRMASRTVLRLDSVEIRSQEVTTVRVVLGGTVL